MININNGLDKPKFNKDTLTDKKTVSSQTLGRELEIAKRRNAHERNERLQNTIIDIKINIYRLWWLPIVILFLVWVVGSVFNIYKLESGAKWLAENIGFIIVGALLSNALEK